MNVRVSARAGARLIALDLDGTLEDSRADMVAAVQRLRRAWSLPVRSDEALRPHVNRGMAHLYRSCFDDYLDAAPAERADASAGRADARLAEVRDAYEADYLAHIVDQTRLYPGMEAALSALAELGHLAVVTNKPERLSRALLEALGVLHHFAAVIGGDSCAEAKPSPMPLAVAARACGIEAEAGARAGRVFMIGDSAGDLRCGRTFGATVIWCAWGYAAEPGDMAPDHIAHKPDELPALVRGARA